MLRPQPKSGLRKITHNLILDFATFAWTGHLIYHCLVQLISATGASR
jgi:hypothetical protein